MKWFCFLFIFTHLYADLIVSSSISQTKKWTSYSQNSKLNKMVLVEYLKRSSTGRDLVRSAQLRARSFGSNLIDLIEAGGASITDTTLYRKFKQHNIHDVEYETKSKVILNRNLSQYDALLDLAHELTHFVYRDAFNPYKKNFNLKKFIKSTIEGHGGEAHAFVTECKIVKELFKNNLHKRHNCKKILNPDDRLSFKHAVKQFYAVGNYYKNFSYELSQAGEDVDDFKYTNQDIQFISSAYGVPYPVAAFYEYSSVMKKVCENDRSRYSMYKKSSGRSIASTQLEEFKDSFLTRCQRHL